MPRKKKYKIQSECTATDLDKAVKWCKSNIKSWSYRNFAILSLNIRYNVPSTILVEFEFNSLEDFNWFKLVMT